MQNRPTAAELIEAVREFIERVTPELNGHAGFHARVAGNVLSMVERELALASEAGASERIRLRALLGREGTLEELNWELCRRIADGSLGLDNPDLVDHLRRTTLDKVAVDQPNYAGYRRALERWGDAPLS